MLTAYIHAAPRRATYEILEDGTFYGEIPGLQGVYANAPTLEECREQLQQVLEEWIALGLQLGHALPIVDSISLGLQRETA
jgi:predicted RNase H-like HicB family nuclease